MKKTLSGFLGMAMVLFVGVTSAFAVSSQSASNFVDVDGNGVCDNYKAGQGRVCEYGNGTCGGYGGNFVDADGDGICDNYKVGQGRVCKYGNGTGRGYGRNFVDADGDGLCDTCKTGQGKRNGSGFRGGWNQ